MFGKETEFHKTDNFRDDHALYLTYEALFGVPRHILQQHVAVLHKQSNVDYAGRWLDGSSQWVEICVNSECSGDWNEPRGSDLFIKEMRKSNFDIRSAYHRFVDRRLRLHKESVLWDTMENFDLPSELEELPPAALLSTCKFDAKFHYAMEKFLKRELKRSTEEGIWMVAYFPELVDDEPELSKQYATLRHALIDHGETRERLANPNRLRACYYSLVHSRGNIISATIFA